jgi:hypothetical protein
VTRPEIAAVIALSLGALAIPYHAWPSEPCRLALSLGLDSSDSIKQDEWRLQADGVAAALVDPELSQKLIAARMKLHVFEWASSVRDIVPMTRIRDKADLERAAGLVAAYVRRPGMSFTGMGRAVGYGAATIAEAGCWSGVLDISGDGQNNNGPAPAAMRDATDQDLTINGLAIEQESLVAYMEENLIQGAFSFVEDAAPFEDFAAAIRRKLAREIAQR